MRLAQRSLELGVQLSGGVVAGSLPLSDGGDGFLDAIEGIGSFARQKCVVSGPMGELVMCEILYDETSQVAVIESSACIGLRLVPPGQRDIMASGTGGLGDLIFTAIRLGARKISIGLGGSATCDGGLGMLYHLQQALLDGTRTGRHVRAGDLANPPAIDFKFMRSRLQGIEINVFCDVSSILTGPNGSAYLFAPQKGASEQQVKQLEKWMEGWAGRVEAETGSRYRNLSGAGSAGGIGFALAALGANLRLGAEAFCDLIGLEAKITDADAMVTCEGRFDHTSFTGKAPWHAAQRAMRMNRAAIILCGEAERAAADQAANAGVIVLEFSRDVPRERLQAEAFVRLQQRLSQFIRQRI